MTRTFTRALLSLGILALVAGSIVLSATADRARATSWRTAGRLTVPRAHATVVGLPSGEVLVVGGLDPDDPHVVLTTTEIYDPLSSRSQVLPDRLPGRVNQTATLLPSGDVFVVGGSEWRGDDWSASEEVNEFVASSQRWVRRRPLIDARSDHGAAVLADGRILVAGGNDGPRMKRSTEIYDPETDRWTHAAPMPVARTRFSMARLPDGRVLVAGGIDESGKPTSSSVLYDAKTDRWSSGPSLMLPRVLQATVVLPNGDVLLIGGQDYAAGTAERFHASTDRWLLAGELREPRELAQAVALSDGRVFVSGGLPPSTQRSGFKPLVTTEVWDLARDAWSTTASAPSARALGTLLSTPAGLLRVGGVLEDERPPVNVERLDLPAR